MLLFFSCMLCEVLQDRRPFVVVLNRSSCNSGKTAFSCGQLALVCPFVTHARVALLLSVLSPLPLTDTHSPLSSSLLRSATLSAALCGCPSSRYRPQTSSSSSTTSAPASLAHSPARSLGPSVRLSLLSAKPTRSPRATAAAAQCKNTHVVVVVVLAGRRLHGQHGHRGGVPRLHPSIPADEENNGRAGAGGRGRRGGRTSTPPTDRHRRRRSRTLSLSLSLSLRLRRRRCTARHCIFALHLGRHGGRQPGDHHAVAAAATLLRPAPRRQSARRSRSFIRLPALSGAIDAAPPPRTASGERERERRRAGADFAKNARAAAPVQFET